MKYELRGTVSSASAPVDDLPFTAVSDLPSLVLQYLQPSRYVDSDRLSALAFQIIGDEAQAGRQVQRLFEWVAERVRYEPGSSVQPLSASEIIDQGVGVCRDLAHALIGLLRAISLPARYVVGYAQELEPQDIHAWVEVFLDDAWYEFDPSFRKLNIGRAGLVHGRDAADVAIMDQFGPLPLLSKQSVQVS
jgi:transglutaminase-like putative cysteine protease